MEVSVALHIEYLYFRYLKCLLIAETSKNQECRAHNANKNTCDAKSQIIWLHGTRSSTIFFHNLSLCNYIPGFEVCWDNNTYNGAILIFTIS